MYYYATPPSTDEIYHHGIKGMRWGVRRYQNEDGSLTPRGLRRYQNVDKAYHDVAKAIYKRSKKLNTDEFGDNSRRVIKSFYKSDMNKEKIYDKLTQLQHLEETIWERGGSQKEKEAIRRKINAVEDQLSKASKSKQSSKNQLTKAQLMDLGFNEQTADLLEKKTRKSKKAFRMYYL